MTASNSIIAFCLLVIGGVLGNVSISLCGVLTIIIDHSVATIVEAIERKHKDTPE